MSLKTMLLLLACVTPRIITAQVTQSKLSDGDIYKIGVRSSGIHSITYEVLEQLGINPTTIDPRKIQLLGQGGGIVAESIAEQRMEDLQELAILIDGQADGSFDRTDEILFYAEGPDSRIFNEEQAVFRQKKNPYDTRNYYFLKIGNSDGKRISDASVFENAVYETSTYLDHQYHEQEIYNLLHFSGNANLQGSGRRWLGEIFRSERQLDLTSSFNLSNRVVGEPIHVHMAFAARSSVSSPVSVSIGEETLTKTIGTVQVKEIEVDYARIGTIMEAVISTQPSPNITVSYPSQGNNNEGWLDFLELNLRKNLSYQNDQLPFVDPNTLSESSARYNISGVSEQVRVWEVTQPFETQNVPIDINGSVATFATEGGKLRQFIAFQRENTTEVDPIGKVENQNIHGLANITYLIIYHPDFEVAATKLADYRRSKNNFSVASISIDQVFNEFSSGRVDPTAIRDFARFLYAQDESLQYMMLLGDGSFDYKHIYEDLQDESFIPVFETEESFHPITAFPTDDYYALLDDDEGGSLRGDLDIAIGRLPVRTLDEANLVVDKIIKYETSEKTLGDWRINMLFVADDEDANRHLNGADQIAIEIGEKFPSFNINKIYTDAFKQENTPGGVFNFKAKEAINQSLFQGQLVVNYLGHGGSNGWAQERILQQEDIDSWNNSDRLPLLITATCSFAGYDNPVKITAGEHTLTNPTGGAIALFTTVRAVYASSNERLTRAVFDHLFKPIEGKNPAIGDILKNAKNSISEVSNQRKFTLLGDPAMKLAVPSYTVKTLSINGSSVESAALDTLKALSKITIKGEVQNEDGQLAANFNGKIYPTIFDKAVTLKTLAQDEGSREREFTLQKSVIFKGLASVVNGKFEFTFVVPKDINYVYGAGKISYYAEEGSPLDAAGAFNDIIVGGTSSDGLEDNNGPDIEIFMDDEDFVFGGATNPNPTLLLKLADENGINVIGNSIGHDLTAVLDNDFQNTIILNDFYESQQDNYQEGTVNYPLNNLALGKHTISIKAWDIANNSSESFSEFVVVDDAKSGLQHVLNYPNPFSESTCFQFEHQFPNLDIDIRVEILTVSGRLVKTLEQTVKASSTLSRDIKWDGRDDFGDPLANGIYVYRVTVKADGGGGRILNNKSKLEKLVLLR